MPLLPRQLGIQSLLSEALQSRVSTASEAFFSTPAVVAPTPTVQSTTTVPAVQPTSPTVSVVTETVIQSVAPATSAAVSQTPTVSVIVFTTTTSPSISTTPAVASSSDIISSSTPIPSLVLTSPPTVTNVPTTSRSSATASASGTPANASGASAGAQTDANKGIGGGIIALIIVGALLVVLLVGAFTFRRVQVYRRAKRRENNYGAGPVSETAPFPFTNVSETDLKGAEPVTRDFRRGSVSTMTEKPLPSVAPAAPYGGPVSSNFGQPGFNATMSGPYPVMGAAAGYGYTQPGRTASPAPSQAPRMMSPALPPAALMRTASPALSVLSSQNFQAPTPAPAPLDTLPPHFRGKKRVVQTFQPTLPDELDIREGDLVTIVHAYDDGWGLCERNGRRGVVPLECLDLGRPDFRASRRLSSLSAIRQQLA